MRDGHKGDVLALMGLCLLIEKHVMVHLKGGTIWTSLKVILTTHDEMLKQVGLHLVYLGRGNFVRLQNCSTPLQIVESSTKSEMVVIGTFVPLSLEENKILDTTIMSGLGIALDRSASLGSPEIMESKMISTEHVVSSAKEHTVVMTHSLAKKETTTENCDNATSSKPDSSYVHKLTPLQLILTQINVKPKDSVTGTRELLDCIPTNTHSEVASKWIKENMINESVMGHTSDGNDGNESDTTIL